MDQSLGSRPGVLLRPMTIADLLDGAFRLLRSNARVIITASAIFIVPAQLVSLLVMVSTGLFSANDAILSTTDEVGDEFSQGTTLQTDSSFPFDALAIAGMGFAGLVGILSVIFVGAIACQVAIDAYAGKESTTGSVLGQVRKKIWPLMGSWILVHLLEASGFLIAFIFILAATANSGAFFFVIISFILAVPISFVVMTLSTLVTPCLMGEDLGAITSIKRSWRLARRRFWPIVWVAFLAGLITSLVGNVLGLPGTIGSFVGGTVGGVIFVVTTMLVLFITQPFTALVATLQYLNCRIRNEGLDLEIVADRLIAEHSVAVNG